MAHNHTKPKTCKHELQHCQECDIVECTKCHKEWGSTDGQLREMFKGEKWPPKGWPNEPGIVLCVSDNIHAHG